MTADHAGQTGGERERDWDVAFRFGLAYFGGRLDRGLLTRTDISDMLTNAYLLGRDHRPVPVPGQALGAPLGEVTVWQAAREAAVEAVARWLAGAYGEVPVRNMGPWRNDASDLLGDPAVLAALSAAPGQEPAHEWNCPSCGATTRARMADHPGQEQS